MPLYVIYDGYANYYSWLVIVARRNIPKNLFLLDRVICQPKLVIGKCTSARMEGISPSTDINTSKVGRESDKNEFLKAKCYSLPC